MKKKENNICVGIIFAGRSHQSV